MSIIWLQSNSWLFIMLIGKSAFNPDKDVIVFIHVPKTGGTSFVSYVMKCLNANQTLLCRTEKIDKYYRSLLHKGLTSIRFSIKSTVASFSGSHPLVERGYENYSPREIRFISGHVRLGSQPDVGKKPFYVSLIRDPIELFISAFYYNGRQIYKDRPRNRFVNPQHEAIKSMDIDSYINWCYQYSDNIRNLQCRYLSRSGSFEEAKNNIDNKFFLVAPLNEFDAFVSIVGSEFKLCNTGVEILNVGSHKPDSFQLSSESREMLEEMFFNDLLLYEYVKSEFHKINPGKL